MATNANLVSLQKQEELFKSMYASDCEDARWLISVEEISPNCFDEHGMTPLQHAALKGDADLCNLLLENGAGVNVTRHPFNYSALTFAALSGKPAVVILLLQHGASRSSVNTLNKNAAQMAAFVENYPIANIIKDYVTISEIGDIVVRTNRIQNLYVPIHKMVVLYNFHPVRIVMFLRYNIFIVENCQIVSRIFRYLCEKKLKQEGNEMLSFKFHVLQYILNVCSAFVEKEKAKHFSFSFTLASCALYLLINVMLHSDDEGNFVHLERLVRCIIKEYPFPENRLFQELSKSLSDKSSILTIFKQKILGAKRSCATCGEPFVQPSCEGCGVMNYCDKYCQLLHWGCHKPMCLKERGIVESEINVPPDDDSTDYDSADSLNEDSIARILQRM